MVARKLTLTRLKQVSGIFQKKTCSVYSKGSSMCPTSGGQTHVAIQPTFHFERRTSLPSNTESKDSM